MILSYITPNGGTDNCASCYFNKAAQELGDRFIDEPEKRDKLFYKLCYCTLRDVKITDPYWTYCRNFIYFYGRQQTPVDVELNRWILASRLDEGYVRIPWDDKNQPRLEVPITCSTCYCATDKGIEINHNCEVLGFCTNRHYIEWWLTIHEDNQFHPEDFQSPEERFNEK